MTVLGVSWTEQDGQPPERIRLTHSVGKFDYVRSDIAEERAQA